MEAMVYAILESNQFLINDTNRNVSNFGEFEWKWMKAYSFSKYSTRFLCVDRLSKQLIFLNRGY